MIDLYFYGIDQKDCWNEGNVSKMLRYTVTLSQYLFSFFSVQNSTHYPGHKVKWYFSPTFQAV